jgi:hypothetical protein
MRRLQTWFLSISSAEVQVELLQHPRDRIPRDQKDIIAAPRLEKESNAARIPSFMRGP